MKKKKKKTLKNTKKFKQERQKQKQLHQQDATSCRGLPIYLCYPHAPGFEARPPSAPRPSTGSHFPWRLLPAAESGPRNVPASPEGRENRGGAQEQPQKTSQEERGASRKIRARRPTRLGSDGGNRHGARKETWFVPGNSNCPVSGIVRWKGGSLSVYLYPDVPLECSQQCYNVPTLLVLGVNTHFHRTAPS